MVKAVGIDPGTKSFDIVLIEGDRVLAEKSIPTIEIAENPRVLVDTIKELKDFDIIAGPSGYGTPIICNDDIIDAKTFAMEILLLTHENEIKEGIKRGEIGIAVYKAIADTVYEFWKMRLPVCYIPSIILLPTIPDYRKLNKIDMGTADKLSVTVLGVYDQSTRLGVRYDETSFILVEMGYGYNAIIAVEKGRIIDGLGGTLTPMGFLTIGPIDAEAVVLGKTWPRFSVFYGGVSTICKTFSIEEALDKARKDDICRMGFEAMFESIRKGVKALSASMTKKPREILLSGRLTRIPEIYYKVKKMLENIAPVERIRGLKGARIAKEAAQGYAIIGEGIGKGYFRDLIKYMGILDAKRTVLSWVYHPLLNNAKKRLVEAYKRAIRQEAVKRILSREDLMILEQ
ncbi:MAG: DUF1464 domain-containing protein [Thermoprotei archaeon]|nr:MAG: DUF1464 domain-containing protein [Thermoprotei archaeon]